MQLKFSPFCGKIKSPTKLVREGFAFISRKEQKMKDIKKDPFEEYIKNLPPTRRELAQAWSTAIGLQDVDGRREQVYARNHKCHGR